MNRRSKKGKVCAYCGVGNPETMDHVPPKGLFPTPLPCDLITVPCCDKCRDGWSNDDEYFRAVLLPASNLAADPRARKQLEVVFRSLRKSNKIGFSTMINASIKERDVVTDAGIIVGREPTIRYNRDRVARVLSRIVRALFFKELDYPVPPGCPVDARLDQLGEAATTMSKTVRFRPIRWAAGRMFLYTYSRAGDDPNATLWLGAFFEQISFAGMTGLKTEKNLGATGSLTSG